MKRGGERVLFRDLTDDGLVDAYIATKQLAYNAGQLKMARQVVRLLRDLDIIAGLARKRGLRLPV